MRTWTLLSFLLAASCAADARLVPAGGPRDRLWPEDAVSPAKDAEQEEYAAGRVDESSRGAGDASFVVRVLDETTGAPVAAAARLWRLDVAADATWAAGDHLQRRLSLPAGPARVAGLPVGRYRLQIDHQRVGAEDPPAFDVGTNEMSLDVRVLPPRKFHVRVVVVDEDGRRLTKGRIAVGTVNATTRTGWTPTWAHPRGRVDGAETPRGSNLLACGHGAFVGDRDDLRHHDAVADERGFDLGEFEESARDSCCFEQGVVRIDGRSDVSVDVGSGEGDDRTRYGLAARIDRVFGGVRLSNGSTPDLREATHAWTDGATTDAIGASKPDWWRDLPVTAYLWTQGYEELSFTWRMTTADDRYVLKPAKK